MSEDFTQKLPKNGNTEILTAIKDLDIKLSGSIEKLVTWVGSIDSKLQGLEKTVEQRLYDTRPIWHKVVADIGQLQAGQGRLENAMNEVSNTVRNVNRDQIVINDSIRKMQLDFHTIDDRLRKLEVNRNRPNSST